MLAKAGSKEIVAEAIGGDLDGYVLKSRTYWGRLLAMIRLTLGKDPATPTDLTRPDLEPDRVMLGCSI